MTTLLSGHLGPADLDALIEPVAHFRVFLGDLLTLREASHYQCRTDELGSYHLMSLGTHEIRSGGAQGPT